MSRPALREANLSGSSDVLQTPDSSMNIQAA